MNLPVGPQVGKDGCQIWPRQSQDHERLVAQPAHRTVEEIHRARVAPLHVVEHHKHGIDFAFRAHPFLEGAPGGICHEHGVLARAAQGFVIALGKADARDLADDRGHALARLHRQVPAHAFRKFAPALVGRIGLGDAGQSANRASQQSEGRARGQRIPGRGQHQGRLRAGAQPAHEFLQETRLADARRA